LFVVACDSDEPDVDLDVETEFRGAPGGEICSDEPPPNPTFHTPSYDCSESQDLGYDAGVPFDITVVTVDGKPVEKDTANAYWVMREAAAADGVDIHINSGFRTMAEQEYFWMCYQCGCCNNGNLAAQPGYSNHQSGHALDLSTSNSGVFSWLQAHGGDYGFTKTVPTEDWHWEWWGGGPGGGICDIAAPPSGSVDSATCETVSGWAQDPDAPEAPLMVQVVFDGAPGDPGALEFPLLADEPRSDLCDVLGSCDHAFEFEIPMGLRDDTLHPVRVFAIDSDGGENTELVVTPAQIQCAPPALSGVRRLVPDAAAFSVWQFSDLYDVAQVDASDIAALDEGPELGVAPFLVTGETTDGTWLVDKGYRRAITEDVAIAWRFDLSAVETLADDQLADIPEGTPLRDLPLLATADGAQMWLVDDAQSGAPGGGGDGADGSGSAGDGDGGGDDGATGGGDGESLPGAGDDGDGACACRAHDGRSPRAAWTGLMLLGLLGLRRRRR
jgi:MYXO-CTERM domain-containing protein